MDLTLLDMATGREADMGSPFDYFSEVSHPDSALRAEKMKAKADSYVAANGK